MNSSAIGSARLRRQALAIGVGVLLAGCMGLWAQTKNSCLDCHQSLPAPFGVTAETFAQDVHAQAGLSCASCHGGDPTSDDPTVAMSKAAKWKGKIERHQVPELCGSCHSNAEFMKTYNPSLRVDQLQQYKTSIHGKKWAKGDDKVAVCTDCHGVHSLRAPSDLRSPVYPANVASTCARCHADAAYMKPYGIPTNQFANYQRSVHHEAMVGGDLSAPTCTTCHGNHGAAPPGVDSVVNVCATCHVFQAQLFQKSPHGAAFSAAGLPGCVTCHSNHAILHPSDAMIGTGSGTFCVRCHSAGEPGYEAAAKMKSMLSGLDAAVARSNAILETAQQDGMEVSDARQQASQAHDDLVKSRVTVHAFDPSALEQDVKPGMKLAKATYAAGEGALKERTFRRQGLGVSLVAIVVVLIGLKLYLGQIERE